ncbi:hypothetical protein BDF19DRAFT_463359 [Syncephalis fuscata]|nr:hypothetical protein BDF19DRAFT_463359 [Syncephalis fuscata]
MDFTHCNGELPPEDGCDSERQYKSVGTKLQSNFGDEYDSMITYWPSKKGYNSGLWTREWNKYGTCVSTLIPSVTPGDRRNSDEFINALKKDLGLKGKINLQCDNGKIIGTTLYFVISEDVFTLRDPPQFVKSSCSGQILWPVKNVTNSTNGDDDNNGNNGSDKTASSIGGVSAVAFVIAVLTLFV